MMINANVLSWGWNFFYTYLHCETTHPYTWWDKKSRHKTNNKVIRKHFINTSTKVTTKNSHRWWVALTVCLNEQNHIFQTEIYCGVVFNSYFPSLSAYTNLTQINVIQSSQEKTMTLYCLLTDILPLINKEPLLTQTQTKLLNLIKSS